MKQFTRANLVLEHKNLSFLQTSFLDYITPLCLYIEPLYTSEYNKNVHLLGSANDWDSNGGENTHTLIHKTFNIKLLRKWIWKGCHTSHCARG